jgi:hypothetical protein
VPAAPSLARTTPIPPQISPELQQRITQATEHLAVAERELETALNALTVAERADKRIISASLQVAFEKLATAKRDLKAILSGG